MAGKNTAVFAIFRDRAGVEEAVDAMRESGFRSTDISVLFQDNAGTKDFAHEKNTKAPEGAAAGGVVGGLTGGVLGWLAGIGLLAIPGLGPLIAAGPIVAALAGAGALGAVGGLLGALAGMGVPEYEAKRYEGRIREGGILLSVHCDDSDWVKRAKSMLERHGGEDIASAGEKSADFATSDKPGPRTRTGYTNTLAPGETISPLEPRTRTAGSGDPLAPGETISPLEPRTRTAGSGDPLAPEDLYDEGKPKY